jgi:hypothetical protein
VQAPPDMLEPADDYIYFAKIFENRLKKRNPNATAKTLPTIPGCESRKKVTPSRIRLTKIRNETALRLVMFSLQEDDSQI